MENTAATDCGRYLFLNLSDLGAKGTDTAGMEAHSGIDTVCWELFCLEHGMHVDGLLPLDKLDDWNATSNTLFGETVAGEYFFPEPIFSEMKAAAQDCDLRRCTNVGKIVETVFGRIVRLIGNCVGRQTPCAHNACGGGPGSSSGCPGALDVAGLDYCLGSPASQRFEAVLKVTNEFRRNLVPYPRCHACFDPGGDTDCLS